MKNKISKKILFWIVGIVGMGGEQRNKGKHKKEYWILTISIVAMIAFFNSHPCIMWVLFSILIILNITYYIF